MYELLTGEPPFPDQKAEECFFKQIRFPKRLSALGRDLLSKTLEMNPLDRLSARQILEHEWITKNHIRKEYQDLKRFADLESELSKVF